MKGSPKGKSFNDRQLAGQVRSLALGHLEKVLQPNYEDKDYQKAMLLKLAPSLLPRLNELTGKDGEPLFNDEQKEASKKAVGEFLGENS